MGKKQQNILKDLYNKQPRSINKKIRIIFQIFDKLKHSLSD